ncbi:MAG: hypothetical protein K0S56_4401, partial [Microvirga sp.]|nr:hypothetical protein [Microvirga sp.]
MPTELPPPKKPIHTANDAPDIWLTRT